MSVDEEKYAEARNVTIAILVATVIIAFCVFGRSCNSADNEAVIKCIQAGASAMDCKKAIRGGQW